MSILKNRLKESYSQIPNELITDMTISSGALRVLLYLFTKPNDWNVYNKDICKQLSISEQTLSKYWKQLLSSKWLMRERERNEKGQMISGNYIYHIGSFTVSIQSTESGKSIEHSNNKPIKKKGTSTKKNDYSEFLSRLKEKALIKSKVTQTKEGLELFKKIKDKQKLFDDYLEYLKKEKNFAKRITSFMEDYEFFTKEQDKNNTWTNHGTDYNEEKEWH